MPSAFSRCPGGEPSWGKAGAVEQSDLMAWQDQPSLGGPAEEALERLGLAAPLVGGTGWIDVLARLMAVDAAPELTDVADLLQDLFAPLGFGLRVLPAGLLPPGSDALIATHPTGRPPCNLRLRLPDLRPPGMGDAASRQGLTRRGQRLLGPGAASVHGAIAATWAALRAADAVGLGLRRDPVLLFGRGQFASLGGEGLEPLDAGLVGLAESRAISGPLLSLDGPAVPRLWCGSPGRLGLEARLSLAPGRRTGRAGLEALAQPLLARLEALQQTLRQRDGKPLSGGNRLVFHFDPAEGRLEISRGFTAAEGFEAAHTTLRQLLEQGCAEAAGLLLELRLTEHWPAVADPALGPEGIRWRQAQGWGFGIPPESFQSWGADAASGLALARQAGLEEVMLGGLRRPGSAMPGGIEFTTVEDVEGLARALLVFLADIPRIPQD